MDVILTRGTTVVKVIIIKMVAPLVIDGNNGNTVIVPVQCVGSALAHLGWNWGG